MGVSLSAVMLSVLAWSINVMECSMNQLCLAFQLNRTVQAQRCVPRVLPLIYPWTGWMQAQLSKIRDAKRSKVASPLKIKEKKEKRPIERPKASI